ncbi:MAG: glycine--tRNA ligase subunit beta [Firmicutes bacterium]|nr:glycine--tRNA ligase subunit beta [Bacillota bacterium]
MSNPRFLVEVGVEEIPSRYLASLAASFQQALEAELQNARLWQAPSALFYTPRRLVVEASVAAQQAPELEVIRGPQAAQAWREGAPTEALLGFARRVQVPLDALEREMVQGKEYLVARVAKPQRGAEEVLPQLVPQALAKVALPRSMRWGRTDERFLRPVRWLVMFLDGRFLPGEIFGVRARPETYGNRTDHPGALPVASVAGYWEALARGRVEADPERRREAILREGQRLAREVGGTLDVDPDLLDEVVNLVEWPTPFVGAFDPAYLALPDPLLITAMRVHQRYFPVRSPEGRLMPYFVAVRNGIGAALDQVRRGNERVLRARLADARYFFELDRKEPLESRRAGLENVLFHQKLGTYQDKVDRVRALYQETLAGWQVPKSAQPWVERAIELYKCDLLTHVVGEFPELQGVMGGIYATFDGEPEAVAAAIRDQYRPASPSDPLPEGAVGQLLGILDRVDTLVMFYAHGIKATGSEDPFGLRRAALGLARLSTETGVWGDHSLGEVLGRMARLAGASEGVADAVHQLIQSRLASLLEAKWPPALVQSVLAADNPWPQIEERLAFFQGVQDTPEWLALQEAYRRVARILSGVQGIEEREGGHGAAAEALHRACSQALAAPEGDLQAWWRSLAFLVPAIHEFFEGVLVMDPDPEVRAERLGLLKKVERALTRYGVWEG